jgi:hypothetical protein
MAKFATAAIVEAASVRRDEPIRSPIAHDAGCLKQAIPAPS